MKYRIHLKKEELSCISIMGYWYDRVYRNGKETIWLKRGKKRCLTGVK